MTSVVGNWITALVAALKVSFPDAEVKTGQRQGVSRDKDRINVFADPQAQGHLADRIVVGTPRLIVRYWKANAVTPPPDTPQDPTELYQAAQDLEVCIRANQVALGVTDLWYFQLESVQVDEDQDEWGVEAKLIGYGKNLAAIA